MSRKRALLVSDPAYRALSQNARALLRDLWSLGDASPERGTLRAVAVTGQGGLVGLVGAQPFEVRRGLLELTTEGWLEVATPRLTDDHGSISARSRLDHGSISARSRRDLKLDWTLLRFEEWNPDWLDSASRVREYRNRQRLKGLHGADNESAEGSDDADDEVVPEGSVTLQKRYSRARAPRPRAGRSSPPPRDLRNPPDSSDPTEHHHHPRAGGANGSAATKPPASRWLCFRCHHMHCDKPGPLVRFGTCARCDCKRVGPFAGEAAPEATTTPPA